MATATSTARATPRAGRVCSRWGARLAWTLVVLALAGWLVWLLARPFLHPRTHLVLLTGDAIAVDPTPAALPADYVVDDFRELLALEGVLHRGLVGQSGPLVLGSLAKGVEMEQLADRLNERISGRSDVLLLYVSAHGIVQDGDAWLVASGADPHAPLGGRYRLASLLLTLRECTAATKLLVLDAGRLEFDPSRGLLDNDFPARLADAVHELDDPSVWVLVSHAAGQRSHVSPALRRSVFGYFVTEGLRGAADANGNRSVDLGELDHFVSAGVSNWVRQTTGGTAQQTPLLLWGGGAAPPARRPVLAATGREAAEATSGGIDYAKAVERARTRTTVGGQASARARSELNSMISSGISRATPRGRFGHYAGDAARRAASKVLSGAPAIPGGAAAQPSTPAPADAATVAPSPEPPDAASPAPPPAAAPATDAPPEEADYEQLQQLLAQAWQLRDELAAPERRRTRPVDDAPHLWRELEQRLLALDRRVRTGFVRQTDDAAVPLAELLEQLQWLAADQPAESMPAESLARRIAAARPGGALRSAQPRSLGLAELLDRLGGPPLDAELATLTAQLDEVIAAGNRTDLEKLAAELKPEHDRWIELRQVRRLAARTQLDWSLVHALLEAIRAGEQAAAASLAPSAWTRSSIEQGDRLRIAAERQMLAGSRPDRQGLLENLAAARESYRAAAHDLASVEAANRLANDVWHRLPQYFPWNAAARDEATVGPTQGALWQLLAELEALTQLLDQPAEGQAPQVAAAAQRLAAARSAVEQRLQPQAVERLLTAPVSPADAWRIELLLETSLPSAAVREALTAALPEIDAALASRLEPPQPGQAPRAIAPRGASDARVRELAALQQRMVAVALRGGDTDLSSLFPSARALDASLTRDVGYSPNGGGGAIEIALEGLSHALPAQIVRGVALEQDLSSPASRDARTARLRAWSRALRLVDPRWAAPLRDAAPQSLVASAAAYDLFAWQRERAAHAAEDAPPLDAAFWQDVAESCRLAAISIPRQPALASGVASPILLAGTERVGLTFEWEQHARFRVHNTSAAALRVWLAADWDGDLVAVRPVEPRTIYDWSEVVQARGEATRALVNRRPSLELAPGQAAVVSLRVARRGAAPHPSHLIVRAVTEQHLVRHDVAIDLPLPESTQLAIAGPPGKWSPTGAGATLHPFPNRVTPFVIQLLSQRAMPSEVDVEVFALTSPIASNMGGVPAVALPADDAARLRRALGLERLVAEARAVELPAGGQARSVPLVEPKPQEVAAPPMNGTTPNGAAASGTGPNAGGSPAAAGNGASGEPLNEGLVVVVTDLADKQQTFRWLQVLPQRPQRYIRPQVRYRAGRERIEIKVTAVDPALLPPDGVRIHGEVFEPLPAVSERQLDAVLKAPLAEAEMYVDVPSAPGKFVTLALTVDGYPRAIYYRVPCSGEVADVPEDLDLLAVRIARLPEGEIYKPPVASLPVEIEIDAPASSLGKPALRVEVGIDRNRDRELRGDEFVTLTNDRQVEASLVGISKAGELQIDCAVRDVRLDVPAAAISSGRVNVLARAVLADREAWSQPWEIVIDGRPPRASAIELTPDRVVVIGEDLVVSALADDAGLSGVARLEAMFDLDRSGQFGPLAKPVAGAPRDDGRWAAKLPTAGLASGSYNVLVRAVDRAGNEGPPVRATVRLLTQEDVDADARQRLAADISGVVLYGTQPQAGMTVTLAADTGASPASNGAAAAGPLARATTDAQGGFRFPKVPPGKYVVTADGLVRNKNRRTSEPVEFQSPQDVQPLTLKLP